MEDTDDIENMSMYIYEKIGSEIKSIERPANNIDQFLRVLCVLCREMSCEDFFDSNTDRKIKLNAEAEAKYLVEVCKANSWLLDDGYISKLNDHIKLVYNFAEDIKIILDSIHSLTTISKIHTHAAAAGGYKCRKR